MEQRSESTQSTSETVVPEAAQLLNSIVKSLASQPEEVRVSVLTTDEGASVTLGLQQDDYLMILGQHARILKSLRTILKGVARRAGENISLEVRSLSDAHL